jgi:hypothetical protein
VNSSTLQLSLTPPIYRFDKSAQATTSLTPGDSSTLVALGKATEVGVLALVCLTDIETAIGTAVIDHDDFDVRVILGKQ